MPYPILGIIAITTPGAAICAQHLVQAASQYGLGTAHPEYIIHARPTADFISAVNQEDWHGVATLVMDSVVKLSSIGARLFIMPSNTPHYAWPYIEKQLTELNAKQAQPIIFLNLITVTVNLCQKKHYSSVLLLGTAQTMRGDLYKKQFEDNFIACYVPSEEDITFLDKYIKTSLVKNITDDVQTNRVIELINNLYSSYKFDAVILGCTELPMILTTELLAKRADWNNAIELVDTTYILGENALENAIQLAKLDMVNTSFIGVTYKLMALT